jgi:hypothetical protein
MKSKLFTVVATIFLASCSSTIYPPTEADIAANDMMCDTWVATDALGRDMPTADSVGLKKTDHVRKVGIFYIT